MKKCPACGHESVKVLYAGIPFKLCNNEQCNTIFGLGSYLITLLPFNGMLVEYEGNYFEALWFFLTYEEE